ncbi:MAG: aspartate aminotransferase family protein [Bacteroidales bacterium]|jgi:glutamate/tyrosine decarboxylase-like PLP-dependent enzyme|nr:aspartate aminotransferase family protein [Bacteroidales bacterium]
MKRNFKVFPQKGMAAEEVLSLISKKKSGDRPWENGNMFGYVYSPEPEIAEIIKKVSLMYFSQNAINSSLFPSLPYFENGVIAAVKELLHGKDDVCGNITSGGTESIFLALKACRDMVRKTRPQIIKPEIILPVSVHPAFYKAAHCLGIKTVPLPLDASYRADVRHLPELVSENTIMVGLSAPCYPYGTADPVEEAGHFCREKGLLLHVDACLGGFMLPFIEKAGYPVPAFDFRVKGVTSISADLHKYGYGAKGSSIILYRDRSLRREQFFVNSTWPGGLFGTPTLLGSRSGAPIVIAWALFHLLGEEGYVRMAVKNAETVHKMTDRIRNIPGLRIVGEPVMGVFAFTSDRCNIFQVGDELYKRGWTLDRIKYPEALHLIVTHPNLDRTEAFLHDLEDVVNTLADAQDKTLVTRLAMKAAGTVIRAFPGTAQAFFASRAVKAIKKDSRKVHTHGAAFYGISTELESAANMDQAVIEFLDRLYSQAT